MNISSRTSIDPFGEGNLLKALMISTTIAHAIGVGGLYLAQDLNSAIGVFLIVLLPFVNGFVTAQMVSGAKLMIGSVLMVVFILLGVFALAGLEATVFVLVSTPLVIIGLPLGAIAGNLVRRNL